MVPAPGTAALQDDGAKDDHVPGTPKTSSGTFLLHLREPVDPATQADPIGGGRTYEDGERRDRRVVAAVHALVSGQTLGTLSPIPLTEADSVEIVWEDLEYFEPKTRSQKLSWWKKQETPAEMMALMSRVSGRAGPGDFLALMGREGSGKSLLLAALGGRLRDPNQLRGTVKYNGQAWEKWMRRTVGFVEQVPVLQPNLTVKETLMYAAMLRMPQNVDYTDRVVRVEHVIDSLDLTQCADSVVGGEPGSRLYALVNERKRLAIGLEMIMTPVVLLLDEPTSGLDGALALRVCRSLAEYASAGRTIVATMKQPSTRMFSLFSHLLLFADGGSPIYFGPAREALPHFETLGHKPGPGIGPGEYLLDLAVMEPYNASIHFGNTTKLIRAWRDKEVELKRQRLEQPAGDTDSVKMASDMERGRARFTMEVDTVTATWINKRWQTSWMFQFKVLLKRNMKSYNLYNWTVLYVASIVSFCALLTGCLWYQRNDRTNRGIRDQAGLLYYITMFWNVLPLLSTVMTFLQDRPVVHREQESGMYHISAYYTSRILLYSAYEMLPPVLFGSIVYYMAGLNSSFQSFVLFLLISVMHSLVSSSVGLAFGAIMETPQQAIWGAAVVMLIGLNVVSFLITDPPRWVAWTRWLSHNTYVYFLFMRVQYPDLDKPYDCGRPSPCKLSEHLELERFSGTFSENGGVASVILFGMLLFYRLLGFFFLRWRTVPRH